MNPTSYESDQDPLGLRALPAMDPPEDGWHEIRHQLVRDRRQRRLRTVGSWAAAASVAVAVLLLTANPGRAPAPSHEQDLAGLPPGAGIEAPLAEQESVTLDELVTLSQMLEQRLRRLRGQTGAVAGEAALYIAELEDMIVRVDGALTEHPDSVDLWGQRVNLMLDLELIYQHHWEREYGRMAAL